MSNRHTILASPPKRNFDSTSRWQTFSSIKTPKKNNPVIPAVSFFFNFFKFKKKKYFFLIPHSTIFVNLDRVFSSYLVNFVFLQKSKFYKKQKKQK